MLPFSARLRLTALMTVFVYPIVTLYLYVLMPLTPGWDIWQRSLILVPLMAATIVLVLVPFIHLSVYLFRTLHPQPILLKPSRPSLPPEMLRTLLTSMGVYTVLYLGYVTLRYGIGLRRAAQLREADDA